MSKIKSRPKTAKKFDDYLRLSASSFLNGNPLVLYFNVSRISDNVFLLRLPYLLRSRLISLNYDGVWDPARYVSSICSK